MASLYDLKPAFQAWLRPRCAMLARAGVTANQVTLGAALLSLAAGILVAVAPAAGWPLLLYPPVLFARMALNAIDGMLAREHGQATPLGALFNELGDIVSDAALYLPLALVPGVPAGLVVLCVVLAGLTETAGILAKTIGSERRYDGPLGKSDRAFVFGGIALLLGLGLAPGLWLESLLWLVVVLSGVTVARRVRSALKSAVP